LINNNLKKIRIPPHLAVSIPEIAGAYVGGTNGFQTIQALFNSSSIGIHLINSDTLNEGKITDNFNNRISVSNLMHKHTFSNQFLGLQQEILCLNRFDNYIKDIICNFLHNSNL
jgi:hypothetical protein